MSLINQASPSTPISAAPVKMRLSADAGFFLGLLLGQIGMSKPNLAARHQLALPGGGSSVAELTTCLASWTRS